MKIYRPFEKEVPTGGVITLGFFDGVHIGHQAILRKVKADAKESGCKSSSFDSLATPKNSAWQEC